MASVFNAKHNCLPFGQILRKIGRILQVGHKKLLGSKGLWQHLLELSLFDFYVLSYLNDKNN